MICCWVSQRKSDPTAAVANLFPYFQHISEFKHLSPPGFPVYCIELMMQAHGEEYGHNLNENSVLVENWYEADGDVRWSDWLLAKCRITDGRTDGWMDRQPPWLHGSPLRVTAIITEHSRPRPATKVVISLRRLPQSATNILATSKNSWGSKATLPCHFILTFIPCW